MSSPLPTANDKGVTTSAKPLVAGHFQWRSSGQESKARLGSAARGACGKRETSAVVYRRIEEPEPRLWRGSLNSSWSVPPQCQ